jgi:hypothetical protein
MTDALVATLNRAGFQPIFLPQTGLTPPELYNLTSARHKPRLVRRGPLSRYLPQAMSFPITRVSLADITHVRTTGKSLSASAEFLSQCLACLGVTSAPKLDLSFAGSAKLAFAFRDVYSSRVDPADVDHALENLDLGAIPPEYVDRGFLHIAFEYAFAKALVMQREDGKDFAVRAGADISSFISLGLGASFNVESASIISLAAAPGAEAPAFAYRAGRLTRDTRWRFYPEETYRLGNPTEARPYIARRGIVLEVDA